MSRNEAFEIAKSNYENHMYADIANLFHNGPKFDASKQFGYKNGWYRVNEFNFREDEFFEIFSFK